MSPADPSLPPPSWLVEHAAERLLAAGAETRAKTLDDLVRQHPAHEAPLRRLARDLEAAERVLDVGFGGMAAADADAPEPGLSIGPYRVLRRLGEGAFGVVYLCAQEAPVRREVAVKVLRPGAGDRRTLARFEAERHLLASLSHPAIAQVFDAGALDDGRPFFVLEYVDGAPITRWCEEHALDLDARLELFVQLGRGVQHAHDRGIVHRDLKPANVLVFEQDGRPQPKIIDFGIAKALRPGEHGDTPELRTRTGHVIGTPGYMSPEQATGAAGTTDARSDVFSLGVMLYELLTGELPWGREPTTTDEEPARPSARVARARDASTARPPSRRLAARLRGDLDWIVLRAIARERERRYPSARELAADLERHLAGQPVLAGPPALSYRLRKLVRRRRGVVWAAAAVLVVAGVGVWASLGYRADAHAKSAALETAAQNLLARAHDKALVLAPNSIGLRQALIEDALGFYESFLRERPRDPELRESRVRALVTLAQVHWVVGQWARSTAVAREAVADATALLESRPDSSEYLGLLGNARRNLARGLHDQGQADAARGEFERAVRELSQCHEREATRHRHFLVRALLEWATTLSADPEGRAAALRRGVAILETAVAREATATDALDLLDLLTALGRSLVQQGELAEARSVLARTDQALARTPQAGAAYACTVHGVAATLAMQSGDPRAAVERLQQAIEAARRWREQEPSWSRPWEQLFVQHRTLAAAQLAAGDPDAAAQSSRAAIALGEERMARFPADHMVRGQLAELLGMFAMELVAHGKRSVLAEAEACGRRALPLLDTLPDTVDARVRTHLRLQLLHQLGLVLDARGSAGAAAHWQEVATAIADWRERFGVDARDAAMFVVSWLRLARARLAAGAGDDDDAARMLVEAETACTEHGAAVPPDVTVELHRLRALLAARRGDDVEAAREGDAALACGGGWRAVRAAAEAHEAAWRAARDGEPPAPGRAAAHLGRAVEQHRALLEALDAAAPSRAEPPVALARAQTAVRLALLLVEQQDRATARALLADALPALEALREDAHADCWDEALLREGRALVAQ